jgi:LacI family transcriptional regulator, repressor for deo operon, udp, cdd, tsx, nupC, and nupG
LEALPLVGYARLVSTAPEKVNLADIARLAGVSPATASRALSGHPHVAASTRARVLQVAEDLSYVVSPDASRLAGGATGRVAVVVPHLARWYFGALLEGLETVLRDAGVDVLLYRVGDAGDRIAFFEKLPARRKVDAVVVLAFPVDEREQKRLELIGVDIVAAGGQVTSYPYVSIDDHAAGRQAVDHLIHLGHRRIGMIAAIDPTQRDHQPTGRSSAYYAALADAGLPIDHDLVTTVEWGGCQGAEGMARLLGLREPPTAVYAHSDEVALGAVRTLRRAGLRVPQDVSVIGIDDHPLAELTDLSTVGQPVREQGEIAGRMVLARLRGEEIEHGVTVPTQLVVRGSTAPPRNRR